MGQTIVVLGPHVCILHSKYSSVSPSLSSLSPPFSVLLRETLIMGTSNHISQTDTPTPESAPDGTVLVTGGNGFIASHSIVQLLSSGYTVRATLRNTSPLEITRLQTIYLSPSSLGASPSAQGAEHRLSFYKADLTWDDGWEEAIRGCAYVLHIASPFPSIKSPIPEAELIDAAEGGTLRVLRYARKLGVRRVVITSCDDAITSGHSPEVHHTPFDESTWANMDKNAVHSQSKGYVRSKILAERAAWDFIGANEEEAGGSSVKGVKGNLELVSILPVSTMGPLLHGFKSISTSMRGIHFIAQGGGPAAPEVRTGVVDVRDVALMHVRAMTSEKAAGQRIIAAASVRPSPSPSPTIKGRETGTSGLGAGEKTQATQDLGVSVTVQQIGKAMGIHTYRLPDWYVRVRARLDPKSNSLLVAIGPARDTVVSNAKAKEVLGMEFRAWEESVLDSLSSLKREGLVR